MLPKLNENPRGYWEGMPTRLRARLVFLLIYFAMAAYLVYSGFWWGYVLLALPVIWGFVVIWFLSESGATFSTKQGITGYTFGYLWGTNNVVRGAIIVAIGIAVLGAFGMLDGITGTSAPEPTLAERASEAVETASEQSEGWFAKAKGWFD